MSTLFYVQQKQTKSSMFTECHWFHLLYNNTFFDIKVVLEERWPLIKGTI